MVEIHRELMLGANEGSNQRATGKVAIAHSTATPNASAKNLATFEKRTWQNAYVHYGVDDIGAWAVGQEGYQAWGAMPTANRLSPLQVELCEFDDRNRALKAYVNYVKLLHDRCIALGIPLTLDDASNTGIKTHAWVSKNWEGDHTDPYGYLSKIGINKAQFAADLKSGTVNGNPAPAPTPSKPSKPSKPAKPSKTPTVNVTYSLHVLGGKWLGNVTNFNNSNSNGFAGLPNTRHDGLTVKVSHGSVKYRVHILGGNWLPWVSGSNQSDWTHGVAGTPGQVIDGVQVYFNTPSGEGYQQAYYRSQTTKRSGWLPVAADDGSIKGLDSFAGMYGEPLDRLQIKINPSNPF